MKHNGFEYVDLGLPSGTRWARCNVGANSETDYGLYFAFGETNGYNRFTNGDRTFDRRNYKFSKKSFIYNFTKYNNTDGKKVLDLCDDAAHIHMGGRWHMPTKEQIIELKSNTISDWVTNYNGSGVNGILFTSKSDTSKKLFLPASGCVSNFFSESAGKVCYYWSSSIYNNNDCYGFILNIRSALIFVALSNRNDGNTVRGVFNTFWMK